MPPPDDRSNGRSPPYNSRRYDGRASGSISRNSRDERGPEERRSDDRPNHPSPINSTARLPSGPRGSISMTRPSPSNLERVNQERTTVAGVGSKPGMNSPTLSNSTERGPNQFISPATKPAMPFPAPDAGSTRPAGTEEYKKEVLACLGTFAKQVTENTKLSFEKEKAEKSYNQKQENYAKTQNHHSSYPQISEQQKKSQDSAWRHLEKIEKQLGAAKQEMFKTMESLAARIVSGGVDTGAIEKTLQKQQGQLNELEKRINSESVEARTSIAALGQSMHHNFPNAEIFRRELEGVKSQITTVVTQNGSELAKIRQEMFTASTSLHQQEIGPIRQQLGAMSGEVKLIREENKIMDQQIQQVKKDDGKWEQDHNLVLGHEAFIKTLDAQQKNSENVRNEVVELRKRISSLEDKTAKLHVADIKRITEDIAALRRKVEVLESRPPPRAQSVTSSARSGSAKATATEGNSTKMEELITAIDLLRNDYDLLRTDCNLLKTDFEQLQANISERFDKFQDDNDEIFGTAIDEQKNQVSLLQAKYASLTSNMETVVAKTTSLEGSFNGLRDRHNENVQGLANSQTRQGEGLTKLQQDFAALKAASRPVDLPSNYPPNQSNAYGRQISSPVVSNNPVPGRQSGSPIVNSNDVAGSNYKSLADRVEALTMGISNLNNRFNSLTTDALARQMWSQLDNVHPHLKDATKGLDNMRHTIQVLEGQLPQLRQRVESLEQRPILPPELKDSLENVDRIVTDLQHRTDQGELQDQSLQNQIDILVKNQTSATTTQSNGLSRRDGSSSDTGVAKRKASDTTNGNAKRAKTTNSRRSIINDTEDEESQGNGNSDALSPTTR